MTEHQHEFNFTPVLPLQERMMLVKKQIKRQRRSMQDKNARTRLAAMTGTDESTWNVSKKMFTRSQLFKDLNTAINAWDKFVTDNTTASLDDGFRMIPNREFMDFTANLQAFTQAVDNAAAAFRSNYENEVQNDLRWNTQFTRDDYPATAPDISVHLDPRPIAPSDAFYQDVDDATRRNYEEMLDAAEQAGKDDVLRRVVKPLQQMVARLEVYKGEKAQRWHQDVVDNTYDMLDVLEGLVTDGDGTITALLSEVRAALAPYYDNDKLKESQLARDNARADMENILSRFQ